MVNSKLELSDFKSNSTIFFVNFLVNNTFVDNFISRIIEIYKWMLFQFKTYSSTPYLTYRVTRIHFFLNTTNNVNLGIRKI